MRPTSWRPPVELSSCEETIIIWQGRRARYRGLRKNLFDLRRCAVIHNLHVLARSQPFQAELQDVA